MNQTTNSEPRITFDERLTEGPAHVRFPASKPWTVPRHIPGFRPLAPSERWHRDDFTKDMLPDGWRPLLLDEEVGDLDMVWNCGTGPFVKPCCSQATENKFQLRTRRPLPHTDEWIPWEGGKCPVDPSQTVRIKMRDGDVLGPFPPRSLRWLHLESRRNRDIIAFQLVRDAKPEPNPKTQTLRDRISHATDVLELRDLLLQALPDLGLPPSSAPALPATTHNPANLTPEQVGVAEGWRFLDEDEIKEGPVTGHVYGWSRPCGWDAGTNKGCDHTITYRTRLSREELAKLRAGK